jgi:hypothetical protein
MEYQRILQNKVNNKNKDNNNISVDTSLLADTSLLNKNVNDDNDDNDILHIFNNLSTSHRNDDLKYQVSHAQEGISERLDKLFHKLHHIEYIDANGCIMIKPPKLQRTTNIDCINNQPFSIVTLEGKLSKFSSSITLLENTLNIEEKIALYENRLNKLEDFILRKNEKNLYVEN